jgi:hypothetical protein
MDVSTTLGGKRSRTMSSFFNKEFNKQSRAHSPVPLSTAVWEKQAQEM